jgi:hypothetical protein
MKQDDEIEQYWPAQKAAKVLGLSLVSLRELAEAGKIDCYMTPGGKYRYGVRSFLSRARLATRARLDRKAKLKAKPAEPLMPFIAEADRINERADA